jgi:hypothetical protein
MFYWAELLNVNPNLKITNPHTDLRNIFNAIRTIFTSYNTLPKVLYICPVRQLVYEVQKEFNMYFSKILVHYISLLVFYIPYLKTILSDLERVLNTKLQYYADNIENIMKQININSNSGNKILAEKLYGDLKVIQDELIKKISINLTNFINNKLVHIKTDVNPKPQGNAPVTISVYESSLSLYNELDKNNLKLLIIDEAHLLQNLPGDNNDRLENIITNVYGMLEKFNKGSKKQLVFLSGTVNPISSNELIFYLKKCLNINVTSLQSSNVAKNPSNISVISMDELNEDKTLLKIMLTPNENNNLIILFSKKRINKLVEMALKKNQGNLFTASQIDKGELQSLNNQSYNIKTNDEIFNNIYNNKTTNLKVNDLKISNYNKQILDQINKLPGASDISDPLLLNCVLSGFGIVYNMDDLHESKIDKRKAGNDQQIIANLFSQGKIKTLLATDAVGIGVNLKIKNMFVPDVTKFDGYKNSQLYISNASQLYNRVGRMSFEISTIYTPHNYVQNIVQALSAGNEKFDIRDTIIKNPMLCKNKNTLKSIWIKTNKLYDKFVLTSSPI